ncbi:hypothetical protein C2857_007096 [Epichloe festucae Fl1]|uniref:GPI ethanolamine phosphate transferase 2 n=1 Tax=Epichloe festucae (strain Fl1) TaxID=877507 RepID=A0A7S9KU78_EPIFF|nr:hypothetical protein C2857_007096 [Epichloe festucae Fl1]
MSIMMAMTKRRLLLLASNLLIPLGMLIFMAGLFRSRPKAAVGGGGTLHHPVGDPGRDIAPPFNKVIFMVVDALRSDFVFAQESGFRFTQSLIRSGAAIPFTALAAMPTLTVSRIKALTQGSSQSFLDAWLNVANSPEAMRLDSEDTWLSRLKASHGGENKIVFYGIEMWVQLYPDVFDRQEAFSSFHIPHLTNIDKNVTRHVADELARDDWAALVLHYLGLDCIAHMGGSRSSHMRPKQLEMDSVVQSIYRALETEAHLEKTLLVLLGDHGMTAQGNHGGRLPEELAAATLFISPRLQGTTSMHRDSPLKPAQDYLYYSIMSQIDIVPSLSGLLRIPIPERSAGIFAPELLNAFGDGNSATEFLIENAKQLRGALALSSKHGLESDEIPFSDRKYQDDCEAHDSELGRAMCLWDVVVQAEKHWQIAQTDEAREILNSSIYEFAKVAQGLLSVSVDNVSLSRLLIGIACLVTAVACIHASSTQLDLANWPLFAATASHTATMFVPWLVEEEHHYWYWGSLVWLAYLVSARAPRLDNTLIPFVQLVGLQFLSQCVNQNGTKYSNAKQLDNYVFDNPVVLWIPVLASHMSAFFSITRGLRAGLGRHAASSIALILCVAAFVFKLASTYHFNPELLGFESQGSQDMLATVRQKYLLKVFWTGLFGCFVFHVLQHRLEDRPSRSDTISKVVELVNLYLRSQTRPRNFPLFLIFDFQLQILSTTILMLGQSAFYSMGRNNSISTLDLLNGFNGLGESSVVGVMLQTLLSNWIGPVWWLFAGLRLLASREQAMVNVKPNPATETRVKAAKSTYFEYLAIQTMFSGLGSLALTLASVYAWGHEDLWNVLSYLQP